MTEFTAVDAVLLSRALRRLRIPRVRDVVAAPDGRLLVTAVSLEAARNALVLASDDVELALEILGSPVIWKPIEVHVEVTSTESGRPEFRIVDVSWRHSIMQWEVRE